MHLSPEVLNLHKSATWQQEFALNDKKLFELLHKPISTLLRCVKAKGGFVSMFSNRQPASFFVGEQLAQPDVFQMLIASSDRNSSYELFTDKSDNINFTQLLKQSQTFHLGFVLLVMVRDTESNIRGAFMIYGEHAPEQNEMLSASVALFQQAVISQLQLQKFKRLNQDQTELQELISDTHEHFIFAKDIDSRLVFTNESFMSNYPADMRGKVIGYTTVEDYPKEQREAFLANDKLAFKDGVNSVIENIDFPSGEKKVLETTKRCFKTSAGNEYILGISYDLTRQYDLISELEQKNSDLDQVANLLATDVRAPAHSMVKLIKWLEEDLSTISNQDVLDNISVLKARASKVSRLLAQLYKFCFAGRDKQKASQVALTTVIADILSSLDYKHELKTNIDNATLNVPATPFLTVLTIIIENAIEHNTHQVPELNVEYHQSVKHQVVTISDNGDGIHASNSERIFDLFYSTKPQQEDMAYGMSLAIAKKLMLTYKGEITLDENYENGAKFIISWPI